MTNRITSAELPTNREINFPPEEMVEIAPFRPASQDKTLEVSDLLQAFALLSPERQEVILAVAWDGLEYDEAALKLNLSPGTVKSRLWRARKELQVLCSR